MTEPLMPDFEELAEQAMEDVLHGKMPGAQWQSGKNLLAGYFRRLWEGENVANETIARVSGNHHERAGQVDKAEAAWAVAARIALRRPKDPFRGA